MREASARDRANEFAGLTARGDLEGVLAFFADDASMVRESGGLARGRDEIRDEIGRVLPPSGIVIEIERVIEASGDLAIVYHEWSTKAAASESTPLAGGGLFVLRREADGVWRIVFCEHAREPHDS
ncbi:hypothetical protein MYXO_03657 [Myxococcaceae bacterium]|jgi:uncharacterized protein (TIGR02246 family)|nr:hypothetical protein MYXO_03657 [Myxococcaceae bacterium]